MTGHLCSFQFECVEIWPNILEWKWVFMVADESRVNIWAFTVTICCLRNASETVRQIAESFFNFFYWYDRVCMLSSECYLWPSGKIISFVHTVSVFSTVIISFSDSSALNVYVYFQKSFGWILFILLIRYWLICAYAWCEPYSLALLPIIPCKATTLTTLYHQALRGCFLTSRRVCKNHNPAYYTKPYTVWADLWLEQYHSSQ